MESPRSQNLVSFLTAASAEMEAGATAERFVYLRYEVFNRLYPHPVFSTKESEPAFFAQTLSYVTGSTPIPKATDEDRPFHSNYLDWCRTMAREIGL